MKDRFVIYRRTRHRRETTMRIVMEPSHVEYGIDPQAEVWGTTDVLIARQGCVDSFACGLQAAGYNVDMVQPVRGSGGRQIRFRFRNKPMVVVGVYYFLGLVWASGQWSKLRDSLQKVLPECRLAVLNKTACYYLKRPEDQDIRLIL